MWDYEPFLTCQGFTLANSHVSLFGGGHLPSYARVCVCVCAAASFLLLRPQYCLLLQGVKLYSQLQWVPSQGFLASKVTLFVTARQETSFCGSQAMGFLLARSHCLLLQGKKLASVGHKLWASCQQGHIVCCKARSYRVQLLWVTSYGFLASKVKLFVTARQEAIEFSFCGSQAK